MNSKRIAYFYDPCVGNFYYGSHHPMKPYRLAMTHSLVLKYGLHRNMHVFKPRRATREQLQQFHSADFIDFLYNQDNSAVPSSESSNEQPIVQPTSTASTSQPQRKKRALLEDPTSSFFQEQPKYILNDDCPVFAGMSNFIELFSGASIQAAEKLNQGQYDIAINWSGGMHHARREEASGFCYINDIVLGILELLKYHPRVMYVDIDVHHGDGVQDAFYLSDRVMTVSFHKFGNGFFPGTGDITETGLGAGQYCSINVPLRDGIDDDSYQELFKPIIKSTIDTYRPTAICLQCGADSLKLDRLGCFCLSHVGHGECVRYVTSFNLPTLVLGGGGYTVRNVARAWTYETAVLCGKGDDLRSAKIPESIDYYESFAPSFELLPPLKSQYENMNSRQYLDDIRAQCLQNIRKLGGAPAVCMDYFPTNSVLFDGDDGASADERQLAKEAEGIPPVKDTEFYDDDHDQDH